MADKKGTSKGLLESLESLLRTIGELAETGQELRQEGGFSDDKGQLRGLYGFRVRTGLGGGGGDMKVEPFGNIRKDRRSGRPVVAQTREPVVDVFDEGDHVLVIAEMPGISEQDVRLDLDGQTLRITADGTAGQRYETEVELPQTFSADQMRRDCRNGVLEVRFDRRGGQ